MWRRRSFGELGPGDAKDLRPRKREDLPSPDHGDEGQKTPRPSQHEKSYPERSVLIGGTGGKSPLIKFTFTSNLSKGVLIKGVLYFY